LFSPINAFEDIKGSLRDEAKAKGWDEKKVNEYMEKQTATRLQREPKASRLLSFSPEKHKKLADPYDRKQDVAQRARSFLHANCAQCHVEAGGGNAQMQLEFATDLAKMGVVDVKPFHNPYGLQDAKLVAPGHPERSVLLHRMSHR